MRNEVALLLFSVGSLVGGCKTYRAIPFDAGDGSGDSGSGLAEDGEADDRRSDVVADQFGGGDAPDIVTGPQPDGKPCSSNNNCRSKACVDHVCCESFCVGLCLACSIQKTGVASGRCSTITAGTDPDSECSEDLVNPCGQDGTCGGGVCRLRVQGTACGTATCSGSTFKPADTCNGAGSCVAANSMPCVGNFACASSSACGSSCTIRSTTGCALGFECANGACVPATVSCRGVRLPGRRPAGNAVGHRLTIPGQRRVSVQVPPAPAVHPCFVTDRRICPSGQVCCVIGIGDVVGQWSTSCVPAADCHNQQGDLVFGQQVCDPALDSHRVPWH